jgi:hypothetical protein
MMRAHIITRINSPHGGAVYLKDPLTGFEVMGTTFNMAYDRLVNYRRANTIPIGLDFDDEIETQFCQRYPAECEVNKRTLGLSLVAPGLWDVVRGSQLMLQHKIEGSQLVPQEEANRRAEICYKCPLRAQMTLPCARCTGVLESIVNVITGSHGTPFDEKLSCCSVCKCYISASVWLPLQTQCTAVTDEMRERFAFAKETFNCWKQC